MTEVRERDGALPHFFASWTMDGASWGLGWMRFGGGGAPS